MTSNRFSPTSLCLLALLAAAPVVAQNWPSFRGPHARGVADDQSLPTSWNVESGENLLWRADLPGLAHSSPVVWGERIFVTTAVAKDLPALKLGDSGGIDSAADRTRFTWKALALDARSGRVLWEKELASGVPRAQRHVKASQSNATPATDGKYLVAIVGSEGLYALDLRGNLLWQRDLGVLDPGLFGDETSQWGHASSPILWQDRVFVQVDRHAGSFLAAYELATGKELWKVARDEMPVWATPTLHDGPRGPELIVVGGNYVRGYRPQDGEELWKFHDHAEVKTPTPFVVDGKIVLAGGYRGRPVYTLKTGGRGDLSVPEGEETGGGLVWRSDRGGPYTSTPVAYRGHLYAANDEGILSVYRLDTGERLLRERSEDTYSASPVASDGKIYFTGENGTVTVVEAGPELEILATNDMGEPCMGTPAISGGVLYLRCRDHLFAVSKTPEPPPAPKVVEPRPANR